MDICLDTNELVKYGDNDEKSKTEEETDLLGKSTENLLPGDRFSSWIHSFCVVTFDLELGQAMELVYPSTAVLSEAEKMNICYLAFPDSNSGCMGDTRFHFRMRAMPSENVENEERKLYYYGFVFFRQVKNKQLPRGYFQKSVVIISKLPLVKFMAEVVELIAPKFFDSGIVTFEMAYREIANNWPSVDIFSSTEKSISLPLLGSKLNLVLDGDESGDGKGPCSAQRLHLDVDLYSCLSASGLLPHLQLLWELVLLGEPLVVMATHPQSCSQLVFALVSLIAPIEYNGDYRPYFTIHDVDLKEFASRTHAPPPGVILGVTNPFFAKTLHHWPHIIRAGVSSDHSSSSTPAAKLHRHGVRDGRSNGTGGSVSDGVSSPGGLYTRYKAALRRDETVLGQIAQGVKQRRPVPAQTGLLRKFLTGLTRNFFIPLEQYLQTNLPLQKDINPFKEAPQPRPFDCAEFLTQVEERSRGRSCTIKGDWSALYQRFFKSVNFDGWHKHKHSALQSALQSSHLKAFANADVKQWAAGRPEVEILDMVLRLRKKIQFNQANLTATLKNSLENKLMELESALPDDVREFLVPSTSNS